jgi:hypothetical protein
MERSQFLREPALPTACTAENESDRPERRHTSALLEVAGSNKAAILYGRGNRKEIFLDPPIEVKKAKVGTWPVS